MEGLSKDRGKSVPITRRMVYDGYNRVRANAGGAGVDKMTIEELEGDLDNQLHKLWARLSSGSYFPPSVKRVLIPKGGKEYRPLGIPTVLDRIAQSVVKAYCEPRIERLFSESSYGYRPGRGAHDALKAARSNCWRYNWVIDMDIKGYFDTISHELLLKAVNKHFTEGWVRMYIKRWLTAGVLHKDGRYEQMKRGTPQGGVISPLLANLFLHYAFDKWMELNHEGVRFERYADDIIVHCKTEGEAERLLKAIRTRLKECGLELHPKKTKIVYCCDNKRKEKTMRPKKFTFLGYDFKPRKKWNKMRKRAFMGFDLGIGHDAQVRIKKEVRDILRRMPVGATLKDVSLELIHKIPGWKAYYGKLNPGATGSLWAWINYKLIRWLLHRMKRFKEGSRAATRWMQGRFREEPYLFAHWEFGYAP